MEAIEWGYSNVMSESAAVRDNLRSSDGLRRSHIHAIDAEKA